MTNAKDNGGPAFPPFHDPKSHASGMTLRDYFAGQVVSSLRGDDRCIDYKHAATEAYKLAEAMIEARK